MLKRSLTFQAESHVQAADRFSGSVRHVHFVSLLAYCIGSIGCDYLLEN